MKTVSRFQANILPPGSRSGIFLCIPMKVKPLTRQCLGTRDQAAGLLFGVGRSGRAWNMVSLERQLHTWWTLGYWGMRCLGVLPVCGDGDGDDAAAADITLQATQAAPCSRKAGRPEQTPSALSFVSGINELSTLSSPLFFISCISSFFISNSIRHQKRIKNQKAERSRRIDKKCLEDCSVMACIQWLWQLFLLGIPSRVSFFAFSCALSPPTTGCLVFYYFLFFFSSFFVHSLIFCFSLTGLFCFAVYSRPPLSPFLFILLSFTISSFRLFFHAIQNLLRHLLRINS